MRIGDVDAGWKVAQATLGFERTSSGSGHRRKGGTAADLVALARDTDVFFAAIGLLALGLRAAGQALGWGFQLQQPLVIAALALRPNGLFGRAEVKKV